MIKPYFLRKNNLSMHNNYTHPITEAKILTVFKLCDKTFVYFENDDVFSTVIPLPCCVVLLLNLNSVQISECPSVNIGSSSVMH